MSALYACPRCARTGFYLSGLRFHVCDGMVPLAERRRLTDAEIATARAHAADRAAAAPTLKPLRATPVKRTQGGAS